MCNINNIQCAMFSNTQASFLVKTFFEDYAVGRTGRSKSGSRLQALGRGCLQHCTQVIRTPCSFPFLSSLPALRFWGFYANFSRAQRRST